MPLSTSPTLKKVARFLFQPLESGFLCRILPVALASTLLLVSTLKLGAWILLYVGAVSAAVSLAGIVFAGISYIFGNPDYAKGFLNWSKNTMCFYFAALASVALLPAIGLILTTRAVGTVGELVCGPIDYITPKTI